MLRPDSGSVESRSRLKPRLPRWLRLPRSSSSSNGEPDPELFQTPTVDDIASGRDAELRMRMHELLVPTQKTVTAKALAAVDEKVDGVAGLAGQMPSGTMTTMRKGVQQVLDAPEIHDSIDKIDHFLLSVPAFMTVFEGVSRLHPILEGVFAVFQAVYVLHKTRGDNEKKVIALLVQIQELLEILCRMRSYAPTPETSTKISDSYEPAAGERTTLKACIHFIAGDIRACYNACDAYLKLSVWTRVLQCTSWNAQFLVYSDTFASRKVDVDRALQQTIANWVMSMNRDVKFIRDAMKTLLESNRLLGDQERKLLPVVTELGGEKNVLNDKSKIDQFVERAVAITTDAPVVLDTASTVGRRQTVQKSEWDSQRKRLLAEVRLDPERAAQNNFDAFERKLNLQLEQLEKIKNEIRQARADILTEVKKGAHEKVNDLELQKLWRESGWSGAVEARYFIVALKELYFDLVRANQSNFSRDDLWAIKYLDLQYAQAISEAVDEDASGFVTVTEMNNFMRNKPKDWSLPVWIAYWAVGWRQLQILYAREIEQTVAKMYALSSRARPENWSHIRDYLDRTLFACYALTGAFSRANEEQNDLPQVFTLFATDQEAALDKTLEKVSYLLDGKNALTLVLGPWHIEKCGLLLLRVLLLRHYNIIRAAQHIVLDPVEFDEAAKSLECVENAFAERAQHVSHSWAHQNLDLLAQFSTFAGGLLEYAYSPQQFRSTAYEKKYSRADISFSSLEESDSTLQEDWKSLLNYPSKVTGTKLDVETWAYDPTAIEAVCPNAGGGDWQYPFLGRWTGRDSGFLCPSSLQSIHLGSVDAIAGSGTLSGFGWSSLGRATISGRFDGLPSGRTRLKLDFDFSQDFARTDRLAASMLPRSFILEGYKMSFRGEYQHDDEEEQITGAWMVWAGDWDADKEPRTVFRRVVEGNLAYYSYITQASGSPPRARWKAAIHAVLQDVRRNGFYWSHLRSRRDDRKMILTHLYRQATSSMSDDNRAALRTSMATLSPEDGWSYLQRLKWACLWTHTQAYTCNECGQEIIGGRLFCVDCQIPDDVRSNSFDLCDKDQCINACGGNWANGGTALGPHETSHRLVLFRQTVNRMYYANTIESVQGWARNFVKPVMDNLQSQPIGAEGPATANAQRCSVCQGPLYFPFWLCLAVNCNAALAYTCDACVHNAPPTNPRCHVEYKLRKGSDVVAPSEVTLETVHPVDHNLLRCMPDMKQDSTTWRPGSPASESAALQRIDSLHEQHSQLAKEHNDLMGKHTELMSKHAQLMEAYERLSHHLLNTGTSSQSTSAKLASQEKHGAEINGDVAKDTNGVGDDTNVSTPEA